MSWEHTYFAPVPLGLEAVLAAELEALGAREVAAARAGTAFKGPLDVGYRACLWCRTASRVLLELHRFAAPTPEALYEGARAVDWSEHLHADGTLAVEFTTVRSQITHTNFGALKVKDAIVDQFRDHDGRRPDVDRERPDILVHVHLHDDEATVYLDLSGESLHRRHWRGPMSAASLKENLAAGILLLAEWPAAAAAGAPFLDPMCGAGTFPIEAALIAADAAPGLMRPAFGFTRWKLHETTLWKRLMAEARERDRRTKGIPSSIVGFDVSNRMVEAAGLNAAAAGVEGMVCFGRRELALVDPPDGPPGVLLVNPPYGERIGETRTLDLLYNRIGMTLKHRFAAWRGFVFTGNRELAGKVGLKAARRHVLYNGAIECRLVEFPVLPPKPEEDEAEACLPEVKAPAAGCEVASAVSPGPHSASRSTSLGAGRTPHSVRGDGGETFANRLRKNVKKLRAWLVREGVTCYRAYDRDIPEYALAVDVYEQWAHVQEDERQDSIDPLRAEARLHDAMAAIREVLEIPAERIFIKHRGHNWGPTQHGRAGEDEALVEVKEGGLRFLANLSDYFDCGLFLDHRLTRGIVRDLAAGKRFLNLFAYTGSATVYAAAGGASETTTVDLSQTYLAWAERNMQLNGFSGRRHQFVRADALRFIEQERGRYDLIFLDPPTFSHSKGMQGSFQVQRDQARLLNATFQLLRPGGVLLFSNNFRQFKMEPGTLEGAGIEEISRRTIPLDFARNQRIHRCWKICRKR